MSKGSGRRDKSKDVPAKKFNDEWERLFGKKKKAQKSNTDAIM